MKARNTISSVLGGAAVLTTILLTACPLPSNPEENDGDGGSGGGISKQPITSVSGTVAGYFDVAEEEAFSYDFAGTGKSTYFGYQGQDPASYGDFKNDGASFNFALPASVDLPEGATGDIVFGPGLTYGDPSARFTEGYVAIISREPFPHSILEDRGELTVMKNRSTSSGFEYIRYVYASVPTTVTGTDSAGQSFNLDLDQGWNQVLARISFAGTGTQYLSTTPSGTFTYTALMQQGQIFIEGNPTKTVGDADYGFSGRRIVLEYGAAPTTLYTPAGQGNFAYVLPERVPDERLDGPDGLTVTGGDGNFKFTMASLEVKAVGSENGDSLAGIFFGKTEGETLVYVTYFYSNQGGITLSGSDGDGFSYDNVSLSRGWNSVKVEGVGLTVTFSNLDSGDTAGMEWRVYEY